MNANAAPTHHARPSLAAYVGTVAGLLPVFVITGIVILFGAIAEILLGPELKKKSLEESQLRQ